MIRHPWPSLINSGGPDTDLKALTGEFTPPGKYCFASSKRAADFFLFIVLTRFIILNFTQGLISISPPKIMQK